MDKICIERGSTDTEINKVFGLTVGEVFHVKEDDFYQVVARISNLIPETLTFNIVAVMAGTDLFSTYGSGHFVVTENTSNQVVT